MLGKLSNNKYLFYLCAAFLLAVFLSMRLSFFLYYPAVRGAADTLRYVELAAQIKAGDLPQFTIGSPGYPLFIWAVSLFSNRWLAVIAAQQALSLASALFLIYGVYRLRRSLTFAATLAMAGFTGGTQVLYYDSYVLSESLYASCIVLTYAFLLLAFAARRARYFGLTSFAMAAIIIVRPAGSYFAVIYILLLLYLLWNKYGKKITAAFLIPFPAALLLLCSYNYVTANFFAISAFGEANLALATISFWQPDPKFPVEVNRALEELPEQLYERVNFTAADRLLLENSWDLHELNVIFKKTYDAAFLDYAYGKKFETAQRKGYLENRALVREVIFASIKKNPTIYVKFVWVNWVYYFRNIDARFDFYAYQMETISHYRQVEERPSKNAFANELAREYMDSWKDAEPVSENRLLSALRLTVQTGQWNIFQQRLWGWVCLTAFVISSILLAFSKGRHMGAFLLFIMTVSVIGSSLTIALVEEALERYAYPTQFIYYLSAALAPLLWLDHNADSNVPKNN